MKNKTQKYEGHKTILLADDHAIIREGIKSIFETKGWRYNMVEVMECSEVLARLRGAKIHAAIFDIHLSDGNILSILPHVRRLYPDLPILIYSVASDEIYARRLLQLGVNGFVSKRSSIAELEKAIEHILAGDFFVNEQYQRLLRQSVNKKGLNQNPIDQLSDRELQIVQFLVMSHNLPEIAAMVGLSMSTVHTYKQRAMEKLGVQSLLQLKELFDVFDACSRSQPAKVVDEPFPTVDNKIHRRTGRA